jgi:hypothetical protein
MWRVAQSQYDPLELLSVYMVKWKLLMRKVTLNGKGGGWESALDREEEEEFRGLLRDMNELCQGFSLIGKGTWWPPQNR